MFGKGKNDTRDVIHDSLEYLSVANASQITDESMRFVALLRNLQDLCIFGCHKITDSGVYNLANRGLSSLHRFNYCGSYKITDGARRYIFSQNAQLLIYNNVTEFGKHYDIESESKMEEENRLNAKQKFPDEEAKVSEANFLKRINF